MLFQPQDGSSSVSLMDILYLHSTVFQKECLMPVTGIRISSSHLISPLVSCPLRKRGRWIQCELHKDLVNKSSKASESERANGGWLCTKEEALPNYISKVIWCLTSPAPKLGNVFWVTAVSLKPILPEILAAVFCLILTFSCFSRPNHIICLCSCLKRRKWREKRKWTGYSWIWSITCLLQLSTVSSSQRA